MSSQSPPSRLAPSLLGGFVAVAIVDGIAALVSAATRSSAATAVVESLYAAGHLVGVGVLAAALAEAGALVGSRIASPRARRLGAAAYAFAIGASAALLLLAIDLSVFAAPLRAAGYLTVGVIVAIVVSTRGLLARSWVVAALFAAVSIAGAVEHPLLERSYAGLHVSVNALAGLGFGLAIERAIALRTTGRSRRSSAAPAWAAAIVLTAWAAITMTVPPPNAVRMALARRTSPSLVSFLPHLRSVGRASLESIAAEELGWFRDRSQAPPVPPTDPPLLREKPIVILVTIDAMRADTLARGTPATARMQAIGDAGVTFTLARSPASATAPAIGALMSSKYYSSQLWTKKPIEGRFKYFNDNDDAPRFAELLAAAGAETKLTPRGAGFLPEYGLTRGMQTVTPLMKWAEQAVAYIEPWLEGDHPNGMLVYAHLMDAHAPYDKVKTPGTDKERYLNELATIDAALGKLEDTITARGLWDRTYLIITADHGEAFGEHGTRHHASTIYEELVRVPLIVRGPGIVPRRVDTPVTLLDVGPTILDLFGLDTPGAYMGQSLVPLLAGIDPTLTRPIILDTGRRIQGIVGADGLKVIRDVRAGTVEAYDLVRDPGELVNLAGSAAANAALGRLSAFFDQHELVKPGYEIPFRD